MLKPPAKRPVRMVLDTDTYNEIDDQFAVVYALISPELDVQAVYAAPFHNNRSSGPGDGMEKSYEEILRHPEPARQVARRVRLQGQHELPRRREESRAESGRGRPDRAGEEEQPRGSALRRRRRRHHQRRQRDPARTVDHPEHRRRLAGRQRAQLAPSA